MPTDEHLDSPHLRRLSLQCGGRSIEAAGGASVLATSGPSVHVSILEPSTADSEQIAAETSTGNSDYTVVAIRYMVSNTAEDSPATTSDSTTSLRPASSRYFQSGLHANPHWWLSVWSIKCDDWN
jgi:hypothetical protein